MHLTHYLKLYLSFTISSNVLKQLCAYHNELCNSAQVHPFCFAGRHSSVGSDVTWESRGTAIDPRVQRIFS